MRIALFSDVHGNRAALAAVLEAIDALAPDEVHALGDMVGRGPEPEAVMRLLRERGIVTLRGNWDAWVAGAPGWSERRRRRAWVEAARRLTTPETRASLMQGPILRRLHYGTRTLLLAHGSPRDPVELLTPEMSDEQLAAAIRDAGADVVAVGHSHRPFVRRVAGTLLVNTGTVGYAFSGDPRATFALLEIDGTTRAEIVSVDYRLGRNLRAMARAVKKGIVRAEDATSYRRALLGDSPSGAPQPDGTAHGSDARGSDARGSDALLALLADAIRRACQPRPPGGTSSVASGGSLDAPEAEIGAAWAEARRLDAAAAIAGPLWSGRRRRRARKITGSLVQAIAPIAGALEVRGALLALARSDEERALVDRLAAALGRRARRGWAALEASGARLLRCARADRPRTVARDGAEARLELGLALTQLTMRPRKHGPTLGSVLDRALTAERGRIAVNGARRGALQAGRIARAAERIRVAAEVVPGGAVEAGRAEALAARARASETQRALLELLRRPRAARLAGADIGALIARAEDATAATEAQLRALLGDPCWP